jgi:hypothetical protein
MSVARYWNKELKVCGLSYHKITTYQFSTNAKDGLQLQSKETGGLVNTYSNKKICFLIVNKMSIFNIQNGKHFPLQQINWTEQNFLYAYLGMFYTSYMSLIQIHWALH